jgi:hypothetical protein
MPNSNKPGGVKGYVSNIFKEAGDFKRAYKRTDDARGAVGPGTDAKASKLRKQQDRAAGQLLGSLVGNKYDSKGRRTN